MTYYLAQINIGRLIAPLEDPRILDFVNLLDEINQLAEQSDGFIWRLKDEDSNNATSLNPYDDPFIIVNMSVWDTVESLKSFAYHSKHMEVFKRRKEWFHPMNEAHMALWWVPEGHYPTAQEGKTKLEELDLIGESPSVFTFRQTFTAPH